MPVYLPGLSFGGVGYGGASYGYSPYGSAILPRMPTPTTGGYGGAAYGYASYGSVDITPPRVTGATSLDGFRVEVFFSEDMAGSSALTDPASYTFAAVKGAPVNTVSVATGTASGLGHTSVIITHTGTTLGGQYTVTVSGPTDIAGNPVGPPPTNTASFLALGDAATVEASLPSPDDGRTVRLDFRRSDGVTPQPMLPESGYTPGVDDVSSYQVTTTYPVAPAISSATQQTDPSVVLLDVHPMTSAEYELEVGPSDVYEYDGTVLPDADPDLTGVETGTGSSSSAATGLYLTKAAGDPYGWYLGDDTGRLTLGTTFRADLTFDLSPTTVTPPLVGGTFATFSVCDGNVQIDVALADVAGVRVLEVSSGGVIGQVPAGWDVGGAHTISLIRNIKGDFYTLLFDELPLLTFATALAVGAPTFPPSAPTGTAIILAPTPAVVLFRVAGVSVTATSTIFTDAWNFVHGASDAFTGSAALTRRSLLTRRGPLVRGWGDATPATTDDVAIRIDGTEIDIESVNPYHGEIFPSIPIPLAAAGTFTVDVDYTWFPNPAMLMAGLNTVGLTLNKWDRAVGHTPGTPDPRLPTPVSGPDRRERFPMGVLLGPITRPSPKRIAHRYHGIQRDYSAITNDPTTLLLNQNPHAFSRGNVTADALIESGFFDGTVSPTEAMTPWTLSGIDDGGVLGDGTYEVVDASSGSYGVGTATVYERDADLSLSTSTLTTVRLRAEDYTADGVFTGIGFGVHDGRKLVLVGLVVVDGVRHVGILNDAENPQLEESWTLGPSAPATAITQNTIRIPMGTLPTGADTRNGITIRIPSGPQAGVYVVSRCGFSTNENGEIHLELETDLPSSILHYGGDTFDILFDVPWDEDLTSFRLLSDFPSGSAQVYIGGAISGLAVGLDTVAPYPADTALLLPEGSSGRFFFGSVSREAMSSSVWDIVQYASNPERVVNTVSGITVLAEMGRTPDQELEFPWFVSGGFGFAEIESTSDRMLLASTSASSDLDFAFGYTRIEPFLTPKVTLDLEGVFHVENTSRGALLLKGANDTVRRFGICALRLYRDGAGDWAILDLPQASVSGLRDPIDEGWAAAPDNDLDVSVRGQVLTLTTDGTQKGLWRARLDQGDWTGGIAEIRLSVESYTLGTTDDTGVRTLVSVGANPRPVTTMLVVVSGIPGIALEDRDGTRIGFEAFDWSDGNVHTIRTLVDPDADAVTLNVDDAVLGAGVALSDFALGGVSGRFGFGIEGDAAVSVDVHSVTATPLRATGAIVRTLGIWKGGPRTNVDSFAIPRDDGTDVPNSDPTASFVEMDWRTDVRVRAYLDPEWGVGLYRPDLPLPPTYGGSPRATETTDPSAAWANVEYGDLSVLKLDRGEVFFGATDRTGVSRQRWDAVRYRIRATPDGHGIANQGMVLNRAIPVTSGEFLRDTTPEVVTVASLTPTTVSVWSANMTAQRMFTVSVDGVVLPNADWSFDETTQVVTLASPLPESRYPVTLTFSPSAPYTRTYLCAQPLEASPTVLNEGTPPVPLSRDETTTREVLASSVTNDSDDVLGDASSLVTNDPGTVVRFETTETSIYAGLETCTAEDGESVHISTGCDDLQEYELEGRFTTDAFSVPGGPAGRWRGSPTVSGSATHFNSAMVLFASGGSPSPVGVLNASIMTPNARGPEGTPPAAPFGMNQDFGMVLEDVDPRTDAFSAPTDNESPSGASPANGYGAADVVIEDRIGTTSWLGPAGGLSGLTASGSLLAGGAQLTGSEFTLIGGAGIPSPTVTNSTAESIQP